MREKHSILASGEHHIASDSLPKAHALFCLVHWYNSQARGSVWDLPQ